MNDYTFKIKSNWFKKKNVIYSIGIKNFWLYINLHGFKLACKNDLIYTSVNLLHENMNGILTKNEIIEGLRKLRSCKIIEYDNNKYRFDNVKELIEITLIDLPETYRENNIDRPKSEDDFYITINTRILKDILDLGLNINHIVIYLCLSNYHGECRISNQYISEIVGISKNTINKKYLPELEMAKLIVNVWNKSLKGNIQNDFVICRDINDRDNFYNIYKDYFVSNEIKRIKSELTRKNIGVTKRELDKIIPFVKKDDLIEFNKQRNISVVHAIKFYYDKIKE